MSATNDYIQKYGQDMVDASAGAGLFPSVMMAQGILESGNGQSTLASKYNNHFGIQCLCTACPCYLYGERVNLLSSEEINGVNVPKMEWFRTYATPYDGFADRVKFLQENKRYTTGGVFSATSPQEQADALKASGYATESNYANQLKRLISDYNLESLDSLPANSRLTTNTKINYAIVGGLIIAISLYTFVLYKKGKINLG
jgi:mannosyl-glycoprotein endo-beta-N-acetylglucosaminidase/stage II sporulation protein P